VVMSVMTDTGLHFLAVVKTSSDTAEFVIEDKACQLEELPYSL